MRTRTREGGARKYPTNLDQFAKSQMSVLPQIHHCIASVFCLGLLAACNSSTPPKLIAKAPAPAPVSSPASTHIAAVMLANLEQGLHLNDSFEADLRLENSTPNREARKFEYDSKVSRRTEWASSGWTELQGGNWWFSDVPAEVLPFSRPSRVFSNWDELNVGCLEASAFEMVFATFKTQARACLSIHGWSEERIKSTLCFEDRDDPSQNWTLRLTKNSEGNCIKEMTAHFEGKKQ